MAALGGQAVGLLTSLLHPLETWAQIRCFLYHRERWIAPPRDEDAILCYRCGRRYLLWLRLQRTTLPRENPWFNPERDGERVAKLPTDFSGPAAPDPHPGDEAAS